MQRPRPPSPSPSPSLSASSSPRRRSHARSSTSHRCSPSRSRRSISRPPSRHSSRHARRRVSSRQDKEHSWGDGGRLIKDSAGLLLGIGAAALVAHRFWPRGMLHGGKEEWETRLDRAADKIKGRLFGDNGHGRDPHVPRRRERGRSRHRPYYESESESERLPSRSSRERVPRGRSAEPSRRRVYQEAVDPVRWERPAPGHHHQGRGQPSYASERDGDQRHC